MTNKQIIGNINNTEYSVSEQDVIDAKQYHQIDLEEQIQQMIEQERKKNENKSA
jgi:hypothetical protein